MEPGFLLHRRLFRDTSLLLECFTRDHGRIGLVARGARRRRSRLPGILQPFQALNLSWRGRGELATLTGAELAGRPRQPVGGRLVSGFYLNELLMRLIARCDPHPALFDHYTRAVTALGVGAGEESVLLRLFERDLLASLGYGLLLTHDADGAPLERAAHYRYDPDHGPRRLAAGETAIQPIPGTVLLGLAADDSDAAGSREARALMRTALRPYLGERPLRSRELYRRQRRGSLSGAQEGNTT